MRTYGPPPNPKNPFDRIFIIVISFSLMLGFTIIFGVIFALIGFTEVFAITLGLIIALVIFGKGLLELVFASILWIFEKNSQKLLEGTITRIWKLFVILYVVIPIFTVLIVIFIFLFFIISGDLSPKPWFPFKLFITYGAGKLLLIVIPVIALLMGFIPKRYISKLNKYYHKFTEVTQ